MDSNILIEALKKIGWNARYCGCDTYQIVSHHKKNTDFLFDKDSIWIDNTNIFGKDGRKDKWHTMGKVKFMFDKSEIKIESNFISVSNNGSFIMFRGGKV